MVDLYGQYLSVKDEIDAAMGEVMRDCSFVRGPQTALLEEELAAWTGVGHCVTCGSGTDALLLAMTAIGVGSGDEVIVPAFTFGAVAETVAMRGATPVFCRCGSADIQYRLVERRASDLWANACRRGGAYVRAAMRYAAFV